MKEYNISHRKLRNDKNDYSKIYKWCQNKQVYEWFEQRKLTYDEIKNKYKNKLNNKQQDLYIIIVNNKEIGLVQIYKYPNDLDILNKYKNTYEYDLFIGEENYLNKGIGKNIIKNINSIIYNEYKANNIILRPFKRNERAIKCYQKCNFKIIYEYKGKDTLGNNEEILVLINNKEKY